MVDKVYINLCTGEELKDLVQGIGASRAQMFIDQSNELGKFSLASLRELDIPIDIWDSLIESGRLDFYLKRSAAGSDSKAILQHVAHERPISEHVS